MEIQIHIGGPLADAINNLAAAVHATVLMERTAAPKTKSAPKKTEPVDPTPALSKLTAVELPTETAVSVSEAPAINYEAAKALAALKAKKVGPSVVKGIIADTGYAQIADIADTVVLASLIANLEAL